jgi:hypothetical protein
MISRVSNLLLVVLIAFSPLCARAQSDNAEPSLGEVARSIRKEKAPVRPVIDNDNLSTVMSEAEANRLKGKMVFSVDSAGNQFQVSSPDASCSLSFNTHAKSLVISPYVPQEIPASELSKLDGPAAINGDALEVSVHNATNWSISEITVGLTILRPAPPATVAKHMQARIVRAAEVTPLNSQKLSDVTVLHQLKGTVDPSGTAVFREVLSNPVATDQDWHWAIVGARGVHPQPPGPATESSGQNPPAPDASQKQNADGAPQN